MNFRLTAILCGGILLVVVVLLVLTFTGDGDTTPTDALLEELAVVKPEQIDTVEIEREDGSRLKLIRTGKDAWNEEWDASAPSGKQHLTARADAAAVNDLISSLLKAKPTTHPELSTNPAVHGLQPPGIKVTLRQGSERSAAINFGDVTSGGKAVAFVTTSARPNRPMVTPRSSVDALFRSGSGKAVDLVKWAADFRARNVFADTTSVELVNAVSLSTKGKTLALARSGSGWTFTAPAGWGAADPIGDPAIPFSGVTRLVNALTNLHAAVPADFVETPTPEQLKQDQLNDGNPDTIRVEITNRSNEKLVAFLGKQDAAAPPPTPVPGMPPEQSGKIWVRVEGQPGVIHATGTSLAGLAGVIENPDPLRDRTLLALDKSRIDGIDIGGDVHLRRVGADWKLYGAPTPNEPQATNRDAVNRLFDALTERRTIKSFPAANDANFAAGALQAEIKVWADAFETPSDPKAELKPRAGVKPVTLAFGKHEGDTIHVRRVQPDGAKADFVVADKVKVGPTQQAVDLLSAVRKSRLDLLDPTLRSFSPEIANKITVSGTTGYELVKDDHKDPSTGRDRWTFTAPADKKGQTADADTVAEMLRVLGTTTTVTKFVNETPDDAALVGYGLASAKNPPKDAPPAPRLKVVIGLKTETDKERVYEFGNSTADPGFVYARQAGKAAVFSLPKLVHDKFAAPDLRDRHLFLFDVAKATGAKFKGWGKGGFIAELEFEKNKDGAWVIKSPPTPASYMLDPAKLTAFLETLSRTPVKSFVQGPVKPEYGFANDKEYLQVTVRVKDHPDVSLTLGTLAPDGQSLYGTSPSLPQTAPIFLLPAEPFKKYKESTGAFAK